MNRTEGTVQLGTVSGGGPRGTVPTDFLQLGVARNIDSSISERRAPFFAELGYSYTVGETYYSGYYSHRTFDETKASDFARLSQDQKVFIRHHPKKPQVSVLRPEDQRYIQIPTLGKLEELKGLIGMYRASME